MEKKYVYLILVLIVFLSLGSRLYFAFQTPNFNEEAYFHLRQIENIIQTGKPLYEDSLSYGGREAIFSPFFYYVMAFFDLFLPLDFAAKVIPNLLVTSLIIIIYLIAKKISQLESAALFTAFIAGFIPIVFAETILSVTPLSLAIPLVFFSLYSLMNIEKKNYVYAYIASIILLSLTHPSSIILILGLILYLVISEVEIIKRNKAETELILFSFFVFLGIQFLLFRKAFVIHGLQLIWQNVPKEIVSNYFTQITILGTITQIGWLPTFYGLFLIFKYVLKEKNKYIYMYVSLAIPTIFLLWLKWINPKIGLIFLGVTLTILFSQFYKIFFDYIKKTKFAKVRFVYVFSLIFVFILTSVGPAWVQANNQLEQSVSPEEIAAFNWLKNESTPGDTVLASLEEGHLVTEIAERKNVWDDSFLLIKNPEVIFNDVKRIYTTDSTVEAVELLNKYGVNYVIISKHSLSDYGIEDLKYEELDCLKLVYKKGVMIYQSNCEIKTVAI